MFSSLYWARLGKHTGQRQGAPALLDPFTPNSRLTPQKYSLIEESEEIPKDH